MGFITLRPFSEPEYHQFFRGYVSDPMVAQGAFHYSEEQVSRSYRYHHDGFLKGYAHYGIFEDQEPVGSFQLKRMDPETGRGEFGLILQNDKVKGRGIGTEAVRLGMIIARNKFGLKQLMGDTVSVNTPMIRIFEHFGFRLAERVPEAFDLPDGNKADRLIYVKDWTEGEI